MGNELLRSVARGSLRRRDRGWHRRGLRVWRLHGDSVEVVPGSPRTGDGSDRDGLRLGRGGIGDSAGGDGLPPRAPSPAFSFLVCLRGGESRDGGGFFLDGGAK